MQLIEHLHIGGAERLVCQLCQGIDDAQIELSVCVYADKGELGARLEESGREVILLPKNPHSLPRPWHFLNPAIKLLDSLTFVFKLARLLKRQQIDILQCHLFPASLWGVLATRLFTFGKHPPRVVLTEHAVGERERHLHYRLLHRYLLNHADQIVAVSPQVLEALKPFHPQIAAPVTVIANAVSLLFYKKTDVERQLPQNRPRIVIVGRLIGLKRHDLLLKALKRCMDDRLEFSCVIIGDGDTRKELENLSRHLGLEKRVLFMGARHDVDLLLPCMDIAVNVSDREGLPISVLEAMSAALPVVATDILGNRELVLPEKTGILCPKGDDRAVAEALGLLIANPEFARKLGQQAQAMIRERYDFAVVAEQWKNLYLKKS